MPWRAHGRELQKRLSILRPRRASDLIEVRVGACFPESRSLRILGNLNDIYTGDKCCGADASFREKLDDFLAERSMFQKAFIGCTNLEGAQEFRARHSGKAEGYARAEPRCRCGARGRRGGSGEHGVGLRPIES